HLFDRRFQSRLHGALLRLKLPTAEIGPVVSKSKANVAHSRGRSHAPSHSIIKLRGAESRRLATVRYTATFRDDLTSSSAICTAFVAAPLRRLSLTHQKAMPLALLMSSRMRPTNTSSLSLHWLG